MPHVLALFVQKRVGLEELFAVRMAVFDELCGTGDSADIARLICRFANYETEPIHFRSWSESFIVSCSAWLDGIWTCVFSV